MDRTFKVTKKVTAERVLLVEDDLALAQELKETSDMTGIQMDIVHDARQAIEVLANVPFYSAVVTDVSLGDMSGFELLRKMRSSSEQSLIPTIVISGFFNTENVLAAMRLGAFDFLRKPILAGELSEAVRRASRFKRGHSKGFAFTPQNSVELLLKARDQRLRLLGAKTSDEVSWHIMLDLYKASLSGEELSVSDVCVGSESSQTTALRRLDMLVHEGLAVREHDPIDRRRIVVSLTKRGRETVSAFVNWFNEYEVD